MDHTINQFIWMICLLGNCRTNLISLQCTDAAEAEANHALFTARTINSDTKICISNSFLLNIILLGKCWKGCEEEKGLLTSSESPHLNFLLKASPINNSNKKTNCSWNQNEFPIFGKDKSVLFFLIQLIGLLWCGRRKSCWGERE